MRVLVSGASGFIGSTLCATLAEAGHQPIRLVLAAGGKVELQAAGAMVHLAGIAHRRTSREDLERVNVALAQKVGEACAAHGVPLIFVSTIKVHGEHSARPLTEASPLAPANPYAASKARAEDALRAIPGLRLLVLRPPLVYGPGVRGNFLRLLRALAAGLPLPLGGLGNRRDLIYVGNLSAAILRGLAFTHADHAAFVVRDGEPVSTTELCTRVAAALARPPRLYTAPASLLRLLPGMRPLTDSLEVDDSGFRAMFDWQAPWDMETGLASTAAWYLSGSRNTA